MSKMQFHVRICIFVVTKPKFKSLDDFFLPKSATMGDFNGAENFVGKQL